MSKEDLELLKNKALTESATTFNKWPPMRLGTARPVKFAPFDPHSGYPVRTDGEVLENGDIIFRFYAPEAHSVRVGLGKYNRRVELDLVRRDDGVYEGTMPHNPDFYGFQEVQFYVDGNEALNPHMPVVSGLHRLFNYMELPDPGVPYVLLKDVPHGSINRELYFSKTVGQWQRCLVYTPPGYQEGGEYPVVYLQDGANGSELTWMYSRKVPYILDNLIAEGKCVPMLAVTNDPMIQMPYETNHVDNFDGISGALTQDCRQFIESRYRAKKDKWNRAIAGFSLGSMQASCLGFSYPEIFGSIGILSGYMRRRDSHPRYDQNPYLDMCKDPKKLDENYKLIYRCMGDQDGNFPEFLEDDEFCAKYGADQAKCYRRKVYEGRIHDINCGRREFYDFAQMLFR